MKTRLTALAIAGIAAPKGYDGRNLMPLVAGDSPAWRSDFLYEHRMNNKTIPKSQGVRGHRWVYARFDEQDPVYEQLFDLKTDPQQLHNLASSKPHSDVLESMRARCDQLLQQ